LLIQRVRDIVTVGRGETINRQPENSTTIFSEARMEFDESLFPNVEFQFDLKDFNLLCDKPRMVRALRNAIENAIISLHGETGFIKLSCWNDERNAYFSIRDNGCGMDERIKNKMLTPYFTTSKKDGGTGIGTMIMQHVAELHNGSIKIYSEKGVGTEIIFALPFIKYSKPKRVN
jgi:signal transduction histidine kinase